MRRPNINVAVSGPLRDAALYQYKTVILKAALPFADQVTQPYTKYVIKWDFDLGGQTVTVPENCMLEFDGGSLKNGTIIGQDTLFINVGDVDIWGENLTREGTWREKQGGNGGIPDKEYDPEHNSGLGRKTLELDGDSNVLTQEDFDQENTIYVITYDFDLNGETIEIPEGCVLDFDGGSINNGTIVGDNTYIDALPIQIFGLDTVISGTWEFVEAYSEWFGAKGDGVTEDYKAIQNVLDYFRGKTIHFLKDKTYIGRTSAVFSNTTIIIDGTLTSNSENGISFEFFDFVTPTPGYTGVHNVVICGHGTIDGGGLACGSGHALLRIHHCKDILVRDITMRGMFMWHNIESGGTDGLTLENLTIYSPEYDNRFPERWVDACGTSIQLEDIDPASTAGAIPYDNTPTKNVIIRNCRFLISENSPYSMSHLGGNHPNDTSDPDGDAVHEITIENCYFEGSKQHYVTCLLFEASVYNINVRGCKFENIYQGRGGIFGQDTSTSKLKVKNVKVSECEFINCQYGVATINSEDIYVGNCIFRGTEPMDGNATIPGEYTRGDTEVNKRFRGVHLQFVNGVRINNNIFTNITLGVNGLDPQIPGITNKNVLVQNNKFKNISTAAVFVQNVDECFIVDDNNIEDILLFPTLEWNWTADSATGIGFSGFFVTDQLIISINRNLVKLANSNCGNIFHKPLSYDAANVCFKDNIVINKGILTDAAALLYDTMISRFAITGVMKKADADSDVISVFEYGAQWELINTFNQYASAVIGNVIDYSFTGTESLLDIGETYMIKVVNIPSPQRIIYQASDNSYPSSNIYGNTAILNCEKEQSGTLVCRSTDTSTQSQNATISVYKKVI